MSDTTDLRAKALLGPPCPYPNCEHGTACLHWKQWRVRAEAVVADAGWGDSGVSWGFIALQDAYAALLDELATRTVERDAMRAAAQEYERKWTGVTVLLNTAESALAAMTDARDIQVQAAAQASRNAQTQINELADALITATDRITELKREAEAEHARVQGYGAAWDKAQDELAARTAERDAAVVEMGRRIEDRHKAEAALAAATGRIAELEQQSQFNAHSWLRADTARNAKLADAETQVRRLKEDLQIVKDALECEQAQTARLVERIAALERDRDEWKRAADHAGLAVRQQAADLHAATERERALREAAQELLDAQTAHASTIPNTFASTFLRLTRATAALSAALAACPPSAGTAVYRDMSEWLNPDTGPRTPSAGTEGK